MEKKYCLICNKPLYYRSRTNLCRKHYFERAFKGEYNPHWKGKNVCYSSIHDWIEKRKPKPKKCERMITSLCKERDGIGKLLLANISGQYPRDISDYEWVCGSCHKFLHKTNIHKEPKKEYKKYLKECYRKNRITYGNKLKEYAKKSKLKYRDEIIKQGRKYHAEKNKQISIYGEEVRRVMKIIKNKYNKEFDEIYNKQKENNIMVNNTPNFSRAKVILKDKHIEEYKSLFNKKCLIQNQK